MGKISWLRYHGAQGRSGPFMLLFTGVLFLLSITPSAGFGNGTSTSKLQCPYNFTLSASVMPTSCANTTTGANYELDKDNCCYHAYSSFMFAMADYASRTGLLYLPLSNATQCVTEYEDLLISEGLIHADFFTNTPCVLSLFRLAENGTACNIGKLQTLTSEVDVGSVKASCNPSTLNQANQCSMCQSSVLSSSRTLQRLTNGSDITACGVTISIALLQSDTSVSYFSLYFACVFLSLYSAPTLVPPAALPEPPEANGSSDRKGLASLGFVVGISVGGVVAVVVPLAGVAFYFYSRGQMRMRISQGEGTPSGAAEKAASDDSLILQAMLIQANRELKARESIEEFKKFDPIPAHSFYIFTVKELMDATDNFNFSGIIGEGSVGKVYIGYFPRGKPIAVKRTAKDKTKQDKHSILEIELLSRVRHPNLASLIGYCRDGEESMLVYEYVPYGNLSHHLFDPEFPALNWEQRIRIAMDCAQGLVHLHRWGGGAIVHRDVKPSNILITENLLAKLSDFGLPTKPSEEYLDPEYESVEELTEASDVYSFGVVLLELISGKRAVDKSSPLSLFSLINQIMKDPIQFMRNQTSDLAKLVDPRLNGLVNLQSLVKMVKIAYRCIRPIGHDRPHMTDVLEALHEAWILGQGRLSSSVMLAIPEEANEGLSPAPSEASVSEAQYPL